MKNKGLLVILVLCFWILAACQSAQVSPTASATSAPPTDTPSPTSTPEPPPTPITYSDVLDQTFSNINILYKDDFKYKIQGMSPNGWVSTDDNAVLRIIKDDNVKINSRANGIGGLFYFKEEAITPGKGVFFAFQYTGSKNVFTWGLDNINAQGEFFKFKTDGYYSFAMQMFDRNLSAHVIEGPYLKDDPFSGNLKLLEGVWYNYTMAFDKDNNYIIKIWEPNSPENQLFYIRNWPNSPTAYYFISWIGVERSLWMDDFTIFSFDNLIQQ
ncbi:MAG: hypothetical protein IH588_16200 [Anaerolineales bacterium]|nr:hypothetical protein [Anaerolineales bacterium]